MTSINYAVNYFYKYKNFLLLVLLMCVCAQLCLTLCNPWTVAHQAPLSMGFSRQEY